MDETTEDVFIKSIENRTQFRPAMVPFLSEAVMDLLVRCTLFIIFYPACCLGIITNIANVIVYSKMGFSESSNVNFLVLSVFDFFFSIIALISRGLYSFLLKNLSNWQLLRYISHCLSHAVYVVIGGSAMMTALIAAERCVVVVFPLKVKTLLTRRRSLYLMLAVVGYHVAFLVLLYADPGPPYDAHSQKTSFYYVALYSIPSTTCFFIVVVATIILVIKLRRNQQWRKQTSTQGGKTNDKDDKLVKTIIAICTIFIICSAVNVLIFIATIAYPPFQYSNPYFLNLILTMFSIGLTFQSIQSSVNFFFYYRMSSRFKRVFLTCFAQRKTEKADSTAAKG